MLPRTALLVPAATLSIFLGCDLPSETMACNREARPAIGVYVRDSLSGQLIGSGATVIFVDGSFVDSTMVPAGDPLWDPHPITTQRTFERPGRYQVTVRRAGYSTWVQSNVVVVRGECHVETVLLTARLVPNPDAALVVDR